MLKTVLKREILHNLYSLRFLISLILILGAFIAGSFSFIQRQDAAIRTDREAWTQFLDRMKEEAGNATRLAVNRRTYTLRPRDNAFIDDAKEKYLPNSFLFSAWNVFGFENRSGSANPFLNKYDELNWSFIAALVVSFVSLIFTFDSVSGEKESKTLALTLSNPVSRATLLFGKFLSAIFSVMAMIAAGALMSLLIVVLSGRAELTGTLILEAAGFLIVAGLLAASFSAFGLLSSAAAGNSNVSLLLALSFFLAFVVVIPNSRAFIAKKAFSIVDSETIQNRVNTAFADLDKNAPAGSWSSSGDPFNPRHQLRAALQMKRLEAEKSIRDAYYIDIFRQFERTRLATAFSPVLAFQLLSEAVAGSGYPRFRKAWDDIHAYQWSLLAFYQELDARDPKSPHWFNPNEDISTTRVPVAFETIPQFMEKPMSLAERVRPALKYLILDVLMIVVIFFLSFVLFVRYDAR